MRLSEETVEAVRQYTDIVSVISDYVTLKKRGRNFIGLCPFHSEKTPSFTVSPEKHIWHCFGCQESGDHIAFVRQIDALSFTDAVIHIAGKAGIDVVEDHTNGDFSAQDKGFKKLQDILYEGKMFFKSQLSEGAGARKYLEGRGINAEMVETFELGYAPPNFGLFKYLKEKGFDEADVVESGIGYKTDDGRVISRFMDRVIFPVIDYRGRTVGFGGRILDARSNVAKYINSVESMIFNKRKILFGLSQTDKKQVKEHGLLIVEGYMDVVLAHQYGFKQAIGTMGTALTMDHVLKIKRFTDKVYMAMDGDKAGQDAIERSYEVLKRYGLEAYVVPFNAKDPADYLIENGSEAFQSCIDRALPMVAFKFERACSKYNPEQIEHLPKILDEVVPLLRLEKDWVVQTQYIRRFAIKLKIDEEIILAKMKKSRYNITNRIQEYYSKRTKSKYYKAEENLIFLAATDLKLREKIFEVLDEKDFVNDENRLVFARIKGKTETDQALMASIDDENIGKLLGRIIVEQGSRETVAGDEWSDYVETLKAFKKKERIKSIKQEIQNLDKSGDDSNMAPLLRELQSLK